MEKIIAVMPKHAVLFRLILAVLLSGAGLSASANFDEGLAAYKKADYATALREWQPHAEQGDAKAQYNLGVMYSKGQGVPQDDKTAVQWFRRAAEQGDAKAQSNLGVRYAQGLGVLQDYKAAVQWLKRAAEQGNAIAQGSLGVMYDKGQGVPKDYIYAHMWANIAASRGDKNAVKGRNLAEKKMTPSQITEAQKLAQECVRKTYKDC